MLLALVAGRRERIEVLFARAVDLMPSALDARWILPPRRPRAGASVRDLGPDYDAALSAVRLLVHILTVGRPLLKAPKPIPWKCSYEEIEEFSGYCLALMEYENPGSLEKFEKKLAEQTRYRIEHGIPLDKWRH